MGGAETSLRELLASVRAAAPDWELGLVLGEDGPLAEIARGLGVQVYVMPFPTALARFGDQAGLPAAPQCVGASAAALGYALRLARQLKRLRPDIVHCNGLKMHMLGAWARPRKAALIWHIHDYVGSRRLMKRLLHMFRKACRLAIVNSNSVAEDVRNAFPGLRVAAVYNAIDLDRFSPSGATLDLDTAAGLPPAPAGTIRVGLLATFARWKGHKVFLEALARLSGQVPVRGYIIGGPIYQTAGSQWTLPELKTEAARLQLGDAVGFTGFLENTPAAIRSLDIVVHASTQPEPFGMVIIEGMACAKAVIASQAGGAAEIFVDGENALAHAPGDSAMLARQIDRLSGDPVLREKIGKAGRATAERHYHGKRLAAELLGFYRELTGAERPNSEAKLQSALRAAGE